MMEQGKAVDASRSRKDRGGGGGGGGGGTANVIPSRSGRGTGGGGKIGDRVWVGGGIIKCGGYNS